MSKSRNNAVPSHFHQFCETNASASDSGWRDLVDSGITERQCERKREQQCYIFPNRRRRKNSHQCLREKLNFCILKFFLNTSQNHNKHLGVRFAFFVQIGQAHHKLWIERVAFFRPIQRDDRDATVNMKISRILWWHDDSFLPKQNK